MIRTVTYSIVNHPNGLFDLVVLLGSDAPPMHQEFATLAEAAPDTSIPLAVMVAKGVSRTVVSAKTAE